MALVAGVANACVSNLTDVIIAACASGELFAVVELVYNTCTNQVCFEDGSSLSVDKQLRWVCSPLFMQFCRLFLADCPSLQALQLQIFLFVHCVRFDDSLLGGGKFLHQLLKINRMRLSSPL